MRSDAIDASCEHLDMAINPWNRKRLHSGINVTPLADVTLSLLILFLVITPIVFYTFNADLPSLQTASQAAGRAEQSVVVAITAENHIQLDGATVSAGELARELRELFPPGAAATRKVVLDGDPLAAYSRVIEVMDTLRAQGIEAVGIR